MAFSKLPRRDQVLELLSMQPRALHAREIAELLSVREGDYLRFLTLLGELSLDGALRALPGQRYRSAQSRSQEFREGRLTVHPRGFGFVSSPGLSEDLFIPPEALGAAMHGDVVKARVVTRTRQGLEGAIEEVLQRANQRVTGIYRQRGSSAWLEVDDARIRSPIVLSADTRGIDGDAAVVEITRFPERVDENPEGHLLVLLGPPGNPMVEMQKVLVREGISEPFSPEVEALAATFPDQLPAEALQGREDLTAVPLVTIDPEDARDHDDAVWVGELPDGFEVWVAIADVASYVQENTLLDPAARARAFSIYLPDRAIPMLPARLASNLCSLLPQQRRLCMAVYIQIDRQGRTQSYRVVEGFMSSRAKLTYEGVAGAMKWTALVPGAKPLDPELHTVVDVADRAASALHKRRVRRGALDFQLPEPRVVLDPNSDMPIDVQRRTKDPGVQRAYRLIEELMLLANETVATWLTEQNRKTIFRIHPPPDETKLQRLAELCETLRIPFELDDAADAQRLGAFLGRVADHPLAEVINMLALRSLKQASYDSANVGHFGLASPAYLHFTSPIRRYPDLLVHRTAKAVLHSSAIPQVEKDPDVLRDLALFCTKREREVVDIEREVLEIYRTLLMRQKIGEEMQGSVVELDDNRVVVSIDSPFIDVRIPQEWLGQDAYELTDDGLRLVGRRSGDLIALGSRLTVRIEDANLSRRIVLARRVQDSHVHPKPGKKRLVEAPPRGRKAKSPKAKGKSSRKRG